VAGAWPRFSLTRHSNLSDINTENVNKLQMIWLQAPTLCAAMRVSPS
jgi:hypothetical protein